MKKYINMNFLLRPLFSICAFIISAIALAQPAKNVETIDKFCATIDASKLTTKEFKGSAFLEQQTSRESVMYADFQGTALKKIRVSLAMGFSTRRFTFYYDSNLLMKAVIDIVSVDPEAKDAMAAEKEVFHGEYYFISEFLVAQQERGKWLFENPANERNAIVKLESNFYKSKVLGK